MNAFVVRLLSIVMMASALPIVGPAVPAGAHAACTTPTSATVRGKLVSFDQCYDRSFTHSGTTYRVHTYYTEQNSTANQNQCTAADPAGRCEHALGNVDDSNGDNANAVAMAQEAEAAVRFYIDRNISMLPSGTTELNVYIAEDPRGGGVISPNSMYVDDELNDDADGLWKRLLAFHEGMHLVQDRYDNGGVGWQGWYGEGIARAIEDRVDTTLDADTGHLFIPEINGHLGADAERTADFLTNSYRSVLWWTWLMDQYRQGTDTDPVVGWQALRDFFQDLNSSTQQLDAVQSFLSSRGSSWAQDFIDYSLALYAYKYNPSDPRLRFLDTQVTGPATTGLQGHNVITGGPAFATVNPSMNPRSSRYYEFTPAGQCDYTSFTFNGNGKQYAYSVMTVDGKTLQSRATSRSVTWSRTVRTADLDRAVGVVTSIDQSGPVAVGRGCVTPSVQIKRPTTAAYAMAGTAGNPRKFVVRLRVTGQDGSPVSGLVASDFQARLRPPGGSFIDATVVGSAYVQDDYWLLVQAPNASAGAQNGAFHDLRVRLGTSSDTEDNSVLYTEQLQDAVVVLDRSGSMASSNKISAARNAAGLFINELADNDKGGYVAFDDEPYLRHQLRRIGQGTNRADIQTMILGETPGGATSIGDGMQTAATEEDARGVAGHVCRFILLSDGHENFPQFWNTVRPNVIDNGCQMHVVALGPGANEPLLQQIASSVPGSGGSYDYADVGGGVPAGSSALISPTGETLTAAASPTGGLMSWQNNLSRIYDYKAARAAGRQRIYSGIGIGSEGSSGAADFEDLDPGSRFFVGGTFVSGGVTVVGAPYFFDDGTSTRKGIAQVQRGARAGGSGLDMALADINLDFDFPVQARDPQLVFGDYSGSINLEINGERRVAEDFADLNGATIGGVGVGVRESNGFGQLFLKGRVDSLIVGGRELWIDDILYTGAGHEFFVDGTSDQLVASVAWQDPDASPGIVLFDPSGNPVPTSFRRTGLDDTNMVWEVPNPDKGVWSLAVGGLGQEYYVGASARSDHELHLFTGTPVRSLRQGVHVPIIAMFAGDGIPLPGAAVTAKVTDPAGNQRRVRLLDDGSHNDGEANDGVYAGLYTATGVGDVVQSDPESVTDGKEPESVGSYLVTATAVRRTIRREAQESFAIGGSRDGDSDRLPDDWEKGHGLDPNDRSDAGGDLDRDGLNNLCEFNVGTRPDNSDTDGGGESDGSEVLDDREGPCTVAGSDPLNPRDDRIGPLVPVLTTQEASPEGRPLLMVNVGTPQQGRFLSANIYRRAVDKRGRMVEDWVLRMLGFQSPVFIDDSVEPGLRYQYRIEPRIADGDGVIRAGQVFKTSLAKAKEDPYAPSGTIRIDDGDRRTRDPIVTLHMTADDIGSEDGAPDETRFGTPTTELLMRISNSPNFTGIEFRPFKSKIRGWELVPGRKGVAAVYIQFKDAARNIGTTGLAQSDSIVLRR